MIGYVEARNPYTQAHSELERNVIRTHKQGPVAVALLVRPGRRGEGVLEP